MSRVSGLNQPGSIALYSNENLPLDLVKALRDLGWDVLTSYEAGQANRGIPDREVLQFATDHGRATITLNREDFLALHRSGVDHAGIIICKDDRDYGGQAQVLIEYFRERSINMAHLQGGLWRVQKQNQPGTAGAVFVVRDLRQLS